MSASVSSGAKPGCFIFNPSQRPTQPQVIHTTTSRRSITRRIWMMKQKDHSGYTPESAHW